MAPQGITTHSHEYRVYAFSLFRRSPSSPSPPSLLSPSRYARVVDIWGEHCALAIISVVRTLDPEVVLITGGVGNHVRAQSDANPVVTISPSLFIMPASSSHSLERRYGLECYLFSNCAAHLEVSSGQESRYKNRERRERGWNHRCSLRRQNKPRERSGEAESQNVAGSLSILSTKFNGNVL
jgi:hypothetical protein